MESIKKEDLVEGEIYHCTCTDIGDHKFLFELLSHLPEDINRVDALYMNLTAPKGPPGKGQVHLGGRTVREATPSEKRQLQISVGQGRWMPPPLNVNMPKRKGPMKGDLKLSKLAGRQVAFKCETRSEWDKVWKIVNPKRAGVGDSDFENRNWDTVNSDGSGWNTSETMRDSGYKVYKAAAFLRDNISRLDEEDWDEEDEDREEEELKSVDKLLNNRSKMGKGEEENGEMTMEEALLEVLAQKSKKGKVNKSFIGRHDLPTITIPNGMTKKEAAEELKRQWEEEETVIDVARSFEGWKWQDVLVAIKVTAEKHFGWINAQQSFMNPPTEIQVIVDYQNGLPVKTTCFYGNFKVAAMEAGVCAIGVSRGIANVTFHLKKKYKGDVERWYELIDQKLRNDSIYKGKSVSVIYGGSAFGDAVEFEIIETKPNQKIVLNPKEESVLSQYCKLDLQEKGKRTYLFTGPYGNAKTESAMILGEEAKKLGMTFFYCKDSDAFTDLLRIAAKNYSPCLLFMEDIDEVGSGEDRTQAINVLLNTLDGAETKGKDIKVLFTTNHHGKINPALRRPGRLDLIVKFENPTEATRALIYERYLEGQPELAEVDYKYVANATPDCSGAFIAEICKRAIRLGQLNRSLDNDVVIAAINSIKDHLDLMSEAVEGGNKLEEAIDILGKRLISSSIELDPTKIVRPIQDTISAAVGSAHSDLARRIGGAATDVKEVVDKTDKKATVIGKDVKEIHQATV